MIEYKLIDGDGVALTLEDSEIVRKVIEKAYPESMVQEQDVPSYKMEEYNLNGKFSSMYLFYEENAIYMFSPNIFIQKGFQKKTKIKLEEQKD